MSNEIVAYIPFPERTDEEREALRLQWEQELQGWLSIRHTLPRLEPSCEPPTPAGPSA